MTKLYYWLLMNNDIKLYKETGLDEFYDYAFNSYQEYKKIGGAKKCQYLESR